MIGEEGGRTGSLIAQLGKASISHTLNGVSLPAYLSVTVSPYARSVAYLAPTHGALDSSLRFWFSWGVNSLSL